MKTLKTYEDFHGDETEIEMRAGIPNDDLAVKEWWDNLSKEKKEEIEKAEQQTDNIKDLYNKYV